MKLIAIMPVRNEEWILRKSLQVLSRVADVILVGNDHSSDRTPEICGEFPRVRRLDRKPLLTTHMADNPNRRQWLLDAARDYDGHNVIFAVDADEIVTATALDNPEWSACLDSLAPGEVLDLQWVWVWGTPKEYVAGRSVWADRWTSFVFRDDRRTDYDPGDRHEPRVPQALPRRGKRFHGVKVLHYARMARHGVHSRQCYFRMLESLSGIRAETVNKAYVITRERQPMELAPMPASWVGPWLAAGIDLAHFDDRELNWRDIEVLRLFAQHGAKPFASLDIWDIDWERQRQLAQAQGIEGIASDPIRDPRNVEQRLYHAYLNRFISTPPWRWTRKDWTGRARRLARRLGLRRDHLRWMAGARLHRPTDTGHRGA